MKTLKSLGIILLLALPALAQLTPVGVTGNASLTNSLTVSTVPLKLYQLSGLNMAASLQYVQIFSQTNAATNGGTPTFSFPVNATNYFTWDFGVNGVDLDACVVKVSTNAATLGTAPANTSLQALKKN